VSWDLGVWADPDGRYADDPQSRYEALSETLDEELAARAVVCDPAKRKEQQA
jgi:hypothetical protein